jgi:predicted Rossmann fold flavoprotein
MLLEECRAAKVDIRTGCRVESVSKDEGFTVKSSCGDFNAESLVIASGGLSFAKVGATGFGYGVAKQFGLKIVETRPSLVPLTFTKEKGLTKLAGVSVDSIVTTAKHSFRENILFTHRGLSGPAILQISNYWESSKPVRIDLMPDSDVEELLKENRSSRQLLGNFLARSLPSRFADELTSMGLPNKQVAQLSDKEITAIAEKLKSWEVFFGGTEGYDKAEVTLGGVDTDELSSQTMEAKKVPGLYFIGEVVDVTGWLGGYNFQWAWSSGYAAGTAA